MEANGDWEHDELQRTLQIDLYELSQIFRTHEAPGTKDTLTTTNYGICFIFLKLSNAVVMDL